MSADEMLPAPAAVDDLVSALTEAALGITEARRALEARHADGMAQVVRAGEERHRQLAEAAEALQAEVRDALHAARDEIQGRTEQADVLAERLSRGLDAVQAASKRLQTDLGALGAATRRWEQEIGELRRALAAERERGEVLKELLGDLSASHDELQERVTKLERRRWFGF